MAAPGGAYGVIEVRLLGEFRVSVSGQPVAAESWRLAKAQDLVKLLALARRHRLHREQIIESLWPGRDPASTANNLHQVVYAARRAIRSAGGDGRGCIRLAGDWLSLCPDTDLWIDADAFERAASGTDPRRHREALALYSGELLPEDRYAEWAEPRRDALRQRYRDLLTTLAAAWEHEGQLGVAGELVRRLLDDDPANEAGHRALIRIHARLGDRAAAVRQFELLEEMLRTELGVDADDQSRALLEDVLSGQFTPPASAAGPKQAGVVLNNLPVTMSSFVGLPLAHNNVQLANLLPVSPAGSGGEEGGYLSVAIGGSGLSADALRFSIDRDGDVSIHPQSDAFLDVDDFHGVPRITVASTLPGGLG